MTRSKHVEVVESPSLPGNPSFGGQLPFPDSSPSHGSQKAALPFDALIDPP